MIFHIIHFSFFAATVCSNSDVRLMAVQFVRVIHNVSENNNEYSRQISVGITNGTSEI